MWDSQTKFPGPVWQANPILHWDVGFLIGMDRIADLTLREIFLFCCDVELHHVDVGSLLRIRGNERRAPNARSWETR